MCTAGLLCENNDESYGDSNGHSHVQHGRGCEHGRAVLLLAVDQQRLGFLLRKRQERTTCIRTLVAGPTSGRFGARVLCPRMMYLLLTVLVLEDGRGRDRDAHPGRQERCCRCGHERPCADCERQTEEAVDDGEDREAASEPPVRLVRPPDGRLAREPRPVRDNANGRCRAPPFTNVSENETSQQLRPLRETGGKPRGAPCTSVSPRTARPM
jgi:hypothetical protein